MGLLILQTGRAAAASTCQVVDAATPATTYTTLQDAVNAALAGDTLKVTGTCTGNTTITVNLTIKGDNDPVLGIPTLVGSGSGTVVTIPSTVTATIKGLVITGGVGSFTSLGGGIHNSGTLSLKDSTVTANSSPYGGGIYSSGTLSLDNTTVSSNSATQLGGGIYSIGTLTINRSTVSLNHGTSGGGIYSSGTGALDNTTVSGNTAGTGGGIYNSGTLTINHSTVSNNGALSLFSGSGIYNNSRASLTLDNTTVSGNHGVYGGGLFNSFAGTVTLTHSTVATNTATSGAGIYNNGTLTAQPFDRHR
jgi:predicted outer membrane repeat protein